MSELGFCKEERLCSEKLMDALFHSGSRLMVYPFSIHWMLCPKEQMPSRFPAQVLIATSKRKFHHAVDRNRVKRLTRECYRRHKPRLYQFLEENGLALLLAVNYVHNEIFEFERLQHKFDKVTDSLIKEISSRTAPNPPCIP